MSWLLNGPFDNSAAEAKPTDFIAPSSGGSGASLSKPDSDKPLTARAIGDWWRLITGAKQAEETSISEAQKARDENRYLSNTAYQRGVADAAAAGINPMVAAGSGGASTPNSPSAHGVASGSNSFVSGMFKLLSAAVGGALASRAYSSVSSAGSVGSAIKESKQVLNQFDKGFLAAKSKSFSRMGKVLRPTGEIPDEVFDQMVAALYK